MQGTIKHLSGLCFEVMFGVVLRKVEAYYLFKILNLMLLFSN